jgi:mannose-1-phosphate guanylyltransferase
MGQIPTQKLWGIVLAAGEGARARDFLTHLCGGRGIKQFCAVIGRRSMLEHTLARVERLIPRERILIVVSPHHRPEVEQQLAYWPAENLIFQPANRETAPGILLPLVHLWQRDPFATVAIFPSDHFILQEDRFMACVEQAVTETQRFLRELILLGVTPEVAEEGYGWIEPAAPAAGRETLAVRRFWEKPPPPQAHELLERGALWNTFVCVTQATTLWSMIRQAATDLYTDFMTIRRALGTPQAKEVTECVYATMRTVNFSAQICAPLVHRLRVLPMPDTGWSDWGTEARICAALAKAGRRDTHLRRVRWQDAKQWELPARERSDLHACYSPGVAPTSCREEQVHSGATARVCHQL